MQDFYKAFFLSLFQLNKMHVVYLKKKSQTIAGSSDKQFDMKCNKRAYCYEARKI